MSKKIQAIVKFLQQQKRHISPCNKIAPKAGIFFGWQGKAEAEKHRNCLQATTPFLKNHE